MDTLIFSLIFASIGFAIALLVPMSGHGLANVSFHLAGGRGT